MQRGKIGPFVVIGWLAIAGCSGAPQYGTVRGDDARTGQDATSPLALDPTVSDRAGTPTRDGITAITGAMGTGLQCDAPIPITANMVLSNQHTSEGGPASTQCRTYADGTQRYFSFTLAVGQRATVIATPASGQRLVLRVLDSCSASDCVTDGESSTDGEGVVRNIDSPGDRDRLKIVTVSSMSAGVDTEFSLGLRMSPIVTVPPARAVQVVAGESHSCARLVDGTVRCWGDNSRGQLGDGTDTTHASPSSVTGLTDVVDLAAGGGRTCAVRADGSVWCWGAVASITPDPSADSCSQFPSPAQPCYRTPRRVDGIDGARLVAMNDVTTCAIRNDATVWCWGVNRAGLIDDSADIERLVPAPRAALVGVSQLAIGTVHACAVAIDGALRCWGRNEFGQLGANVPLDARCASDRPNTPCTATPTLVPGLAAAVEAAPSTGATCVRLRDATVACWGLALNGRLGIGDPAGETCVPPGGTIALPCRRQPVVVPGLSGVRGIASDSETTCAFTSAREVCWGGNSAGQIGNGTVETALVPTAPMLATGVLDVALGGQHVCAVADDGAVWCWGANLYGQLGHDANTLCRGSEPCRLTPARVPGLAGVTQVAMGTLHQCVRRNDGTVACWGGQRGGADIGTGTAASVTTPTTVPGLANVAEVAAGGEHTCARIDDGTVRCWGANFFGEVGVPPMPSMDGSTQIVSTPTVVAGLTNVVQISIGVYHSCARRNDGTVWCWGNNESGSLGDGTVTTRSAAAPVVGLNGVIDLQTHWFHTCAILADHTARCWGFNAGGQLGDGTTVDRTTPVTVMRGGAPFVVAEIEPGGFHTCARTDDGRVWCWGRNGNGALGDGSGVDHLEPTEVVGAAGAVELAGAYLHTCARFADGTARCWGLNSDGQLGNGGTSDSATPVAVTGLSGSVGIAVNVFRTCAVLADGGVSCWGENMRGGAGDDPTRWCGGVPCARVPGMVMGL